MKAIRQGTDEWVQWRGAGIGSSDAPVIMGASPWMTPHELWLLKTRRAEPPPQTPAMRRGLFFEPVARAAYERTTGHVMQPICIEHVEHAYLRASLDGLSFDRTHALEIKVPGADDHATAVKGAVPTKYWPQVQHLLLVSGAETLDYWSYNGEDDGALVAVQPDRDYINELLAAEMEFWSLIQSDTPPPLTERDLVLRDDATWLEAARLYRQCEAAKAEWTQKLDAARELVLELMGDRARCKGGGINVTRYFASGGVDYGKIDVLKGLNLDQYRRAGRWQMRVTVEDK